MQHNPISRLKAKATELRSFLFKAQSEYEPDDRYRSFLRDQVRILQEALDGAATPETYRVAVVGSFKVGKSAFVNALCDVTRLVSVATNPETAAVTTLRHSNQGICNNSHDY